MPDGRRPIVIAVDGPAAAGKGTLGRRLAEHFGLRHLDTGMLYRAVAARILRTGGDPSDPKVAAATARSLVPEDLDDPTLRDEAVSQAASQVARLGAVRSALLSYQRDFANTPPGAVLDGRDIGTVVCPTATAKLFLDARIETRAKRRAKELRSRGVKSIESRVLQDMKERDARDSARDLAPLAPAGDALVIDTTDASPDEVFERALSFVAPRVR